MSSVRSDDDWFASFADEKDLAPGAPKLLGPDAIAPVPARRELLEHDGSGPNCCARGNAADSTARACADPSGHAALAEVCPCSLALWPLARHRRRRWQRLGCRSAALCRAESGRRRQTRASGHHARRPPQASRLRRRSSGNQPPHSRLPSPGTRTPAYASTDAPASPTPAITTKATQPARTETRSSRVDTSARRVVPQPPARPVGGTVATEAGRAVAYAAASSARPAPRLTPSPTPTSTPSTPNAAPPPARIDAIPNPAPAPPPPAAPVRPSETAMVRSVLDLYRQAYSSLDANAVAAVWPSVNIRSLTRAFGQLESQRFEFQRLPD